MVGLDEVAWRRACAPFAMSGQLPVAEGGVDVRRSMRRASAGLFEPECDDASSVARRDPLWVAFSPPAVVPSRGVIIRERQLPDAIRQSLACAREAAISPIRAQARLARWYDLENCTARRARIWGSIARPQRPRSLVGSKCRPRGTREWGHQKMGKGPLCGFPLLDVKGGQRCTVHSLQVAKPEGGSPIGSLPSSSANVGISILEAQSASSCSDIGQVSCGASAKR